MEFLKLILAGAVTILTLSPSVDAAVTYAVRVKNVSASDASPAESAENGYRVNADDEVCAEAAKYKSIRYGGLDPSDVRAYSLTASETGKNFTWYLSACRGPDSTFYVKNVDNNAEWAVIYT